MSQTFDIDKQKFVQLEGFSGIFNTVQSNFRVRFFSTYANTREQNYKELLQELKPMRERIRVNEIQNISQVLQRDLDDYRIANGLIPYLLNIVNGIRNENHIAFFPGILGVIIPKNYLQTEPVAREVQSYPKMKEVEEHLKKYFIYFNGDQNQPSWKITHLKEESGRVTPLSLLEFDKNKTEIIVLDGQHRANAFRIASKEFFTNPNNDTYLPYYNNTQIYPTDIETNLPVTLICFERTDDFSGELFPDLISRKLFIDVNNNAKRISPSRQVLLDDRDPSSLLTNTFYSKIAELYGFRADTDNLSLIHLGFDVTTSISDRKHSSILNISNPELIDFTFDWYFFAQRGYNYLDKYEVLKEKKLKYSPDILSELLPNSNRFFGMSFDEDGDEIKTLVSPENTNLIIKEFTKLHFAAFYNILNELNFLRCHYHATTELKRICDTGGWGSTTKMDMWNDVFLGVEGLYDSFSKLIDSEDILSRPDLNLIKSAILEIEKDFSDLRASYCNLIAADSDSMFNSFNTKAFHVALFMAFYSYADIKGYQLDDGDQILDASNDFVNKLNNIPVQIWCNVFTKVKIHLWEGDTNQKKWPAYQKLIFRIIQEDGEFYDNPAYFNISPEAKMFQIKFDKQFKSFINLNALTNITATDFISNYPNEISNWKENAREEVEEIFNVYLSKSLLAIDCDDLAQQKIFNKLN